MKKVIIISCFLLLAPVLALAQPAQPTGPTGYNLLAPIPLNGPSSGETKTTTASQYLQGIFTLTIGLAGALAVVMIIIGGIKYMSTDAFTEKGTAKTTITNAIWGLFLAIGAWLILYTVNPDLTKFNLTSLTPQTIPSSGTGVGSQVPIGVGPAHLTLNSVQAADAFRIGEVKIDGPINLAGIRQGTVDEVIRLKRECGCEVMVTSATGGEHNSGSCSHAAGYKVDLRNTREGAALTTYIQSRYPLIGTRSDDGAKIYKAPSGALYALESNHWDVAACTF